MIIPEITLPNIFAMPTMEINMAASEVGSFLETPRSGMKVSGTDCTGNIYIYINSYQKR